MFESSTSKTSAAPLTEAFEKVKASRWQHSPSWLSDIRNDGRRVHDQLGLPHRRIEEWKYTDISASDIGKLDFTPAQPLSENHSAVSGTLEHSLLANAPVSIRLVFIDGFFVPGLSTLENLPGGMLAQGLAEALKANHPLLKKHLGNYAIPDDNSFVALNNAFIEDGAFISVPADVTLSEPLHLIYIQTPSSTENEHPNLVHPRNLMLVEKNAKLSVIEEYIGARDALYLCTPVTEIVMEEGAAVNHYKLQQESDRAFHIGTIQAQQGKNTRFVSHSISFGASLTRNNIHSHIGGPDSSCTLNGLFMIHDKQHVDNHTLIYHAYPDCTSSELYHGILDNNSRGVFNGKIFVEPEAQHTDSRQTNRTLMLSSDARMDAKPQLEIFADDVKCTHGATVGRIDEDTLYYLRSRGISKEDARKMLTLAFGQQLTGKLEYLPLRQAVENFIATRLKENKQQ